MGSLMFCGFVKGSELPQLSPNLAPPKPPLLEGAEQHKEGAGQRKEVVGQKKEGDGQKKTAGEAIQVNGPGEITEEQAQACLSLAAGRVLGFIRHCA